MKCWSDEILDKLPLVPAIFFDKDSDGNYKRIAVIKSVNKDGFVAVIESNNKLK